MPQFPFKPDPSDLPSELFPEVILPDENGKLNHENRSAGQSTEASNQTKSDATVDNSKERPSIRFKKRSEAIPLRRTRKRSRSRRSSSLHGDDAKNFFADDQSISDFRAKFSKPLTVVVGILWLLGVIYLFRLGVEKSSTPVASGFDKASATHLDSAGPGSLKDAYQEISKQLEEAERLIDAKHNPGANQRGIALKLKALHDWNVLDLSADRVDAEKSNELLRATRRYIGNKNADINSQAQKGLLFLQVKEYLKSPDEAYWHEVEHRFDEVIQSEIENPGDCRNFLRLADAFADRGLSKEAQQLYLLISKNFSTQTDSRLALLANLARQKLDQRSSDQMLIMMEAAEDDLTGSHPDLVSVQSAVEPIKQVVTASANVPENELANEVSTADHEKVVEANELSSEHLSSLSPAESHVANFESSTVFLEENQAVTRSKFVDELAVGSDSDVVMTEHQGDEVALPVDPAPERSAESEVRAVEASANELSTEESVVSQFLPPEIERASEPEAKMFQPESDPTATPSALWDEQRSLEPKAANHVRTEPESNIEEFLIERDSTVISERKSIKLDRNNTPLDDWLVSRQETRSDLRLEPTLNSVQQELFGNSNKTASVIPKKVVPNSVRNNGRSTTPRTDEVDRELEPLTGIARTKLEEYRDRVRQEIDAQQVSVSTLKSAIEFSDYLIENNSMGSAGALLDEIRNAIYLIQDGSERSDVREQYYSSKKRFDYFGKEFDYKGLYDLQGRPTRLGKSTKELKLIVFWSLQSDISVELIRQIERLDKDFKQRRVQVVAVCKTEDNDTEQEIRRIANENKSIEFCQLKVDDRGSKLFVERFPVRKYPYLLMLSADHKVVGINLDPIFFDPIGH